MLRRWGSEENKKLADKAFDLFKGSQAWRAIPLFQQGYHDAIRHRNPAIAWWFLNTSAGAHFKAEEYRQALDEYLAARDMAVQAGLDAERALTLANLSSLYLHVFDTASALSAAEEANQHLGRGTNVAVRSQVLVQLGRVLMLRGASDKAEKYFKEAIESVARSHDQQSISAESSALDQMGWEMLQAGRLQRARTSLLRAFELRRGRKDPALFVTEYKLAVLNLVTGDLTRARQLIDSSFRGSDPDPVQIPLHQFYFTRAQILHGQGDLEGALHDYIRATDAAEEWRGRGLFADSFRIRTDALLDDIFSGAVDCAIELYRKTGRERYAVLSWELNERIRAASLHDVLTEGRRWTEHVPVEYWALLDRLRALDAEQLGPGSASRATLQQAARLRMHLAEMEAHAKSAVTVSDSLPPKAANSTPPKRCKECIVSPEKSRPRISLTHFKHVLGNSRTLISFHLGARYSYRWIVSGRTFEVTVLPDKRALSEQIDRLRALWAQSSAEAAPYSQRLFELLFSGLKRSAHNRWYISPDAALFKLPMGALVCGRLKGTPVYLIERQTVELVPGAWAIGSEPQGLHKGGFLGIGDGVYNSADPRFRSQADTQAPAQARAKAPVQLPRLLSSQREIEECALLTGRPLRILTGIRANRQEIVTALADRPQVIHIAAHYLTGGPAGGVAIALGLRPSANGARLDILTPEDIAHLRAPGSVVVLSGCSSLEGEVVPAAGLLGLARAWIAAGARAVVATQWPTPDDTGQLFVRFYGYLRESARGDTMVPAEALRRAQIDMIRSHSWRSEPRYWAAYQVIGRSN